MSKKSCNRGLDDRCRDQNGQIRQKRADTHIGTLREIYGSDFASGVRSDMHLGTLGDREGKSLSQILKDE